MRTYRFGEKGPDGPIFQIGTSQPIGLEALAVDDRETPVRPPTWPVAVTR